ncbi:MAG TPA: efflux RND transporter periplasmic adaptor subunit [Tepidisphaeraceae bacterium]|jgi:multidrug efflux system membrane fusion protein
MHSIYQYIGVAALAGVVVAGSGCDRKAQQGGPPQMPPPVVSVADAVAQDVPMYIDGIGKAAAMESVTITPRIAGQIVERRFEDGADLKKGQVLFLIDPAPTEAALASSQAKVAQAKAAADFARIELDRYAAVAGTKAISKSDIDTRRNAVDVAVAQQAAAEADVRTAQINLDFCTVRSPIDGRAGSRLVDVGNVVKENDTPLLSVQKLDPIYADFTVNEQQLAAVRANMAEGALKCLVRLPTEAETAGREGSLTFLDNSVQDATGTVRLRATLPNPGSHFWPGQFVNVRLVLKTLKDAVLVPSSASQMSQKGPYVFVVKPDMVAEIRPIKPGQTQGDMLVVSDGLKAGERVITDGQMMVRPDMPVRLPGPPPAGTGGAPQGSGVAGDPAKGGTEGATKGGDAQQPQPGRTGNAGGQS